MGERKEMDLEKKHGISRKKLLAVGLTAVTFFSTTAIMNQKSVDASTVNNVAVADATANGSVQLYNSVTDDGFKMAYRGLANGTAWKIGKAVKGIDGETYLQVSTNEFANANQMDLADETSEQNISNGVLHTNGQTNLYIDPVADGHLETTRMLGSSTDWFTDIKVVVNGETFYRVSTHEYVKASDIALTKASAFSDKTYTKNGPDYENETPESNGNSSDNTSEDTNQGGSTDTPTDSDEDQGNNSTDSAVRRADIIIKAISADGTKLANDKVVSDQEVGKNYVANAPIINGYTADKDSKTVNVSKKGSTVTFTYTKKTTAASVDTSAVADEIIKLVNEYRTQNGLKALNIDSNLSAGSKARVNTEASKVNASGNIDDANHDEFNAQTQPDLQRYVGTSMAENLVVTNGSTTDEVAQSALNLWKESPDHNAIMLDESLKDTGVAVKQLDNGQFVAIQDFGGNNQTDVTWNSDQFNSTTIDQFGLTKEEIAQQFKNIYGYDLGTNYYVSDHIFKTKSDLEDFLDAPFEEPNPLEGSIWDAVGADGLDTAALIYDANGNAVGWGHCLLKMDEPAQYYFDEGLTPWIK